MDLFCTLFLVGLVLLACAAAGGKRTRLHSFTCASDVYGRTDDVPCHVFSSKLCVLKTIICDDVLAILVVQTLAYAGSRSMFVFRFLVHTSLSFLIYSIEAPLGSTAEPLGSRRSAARVEVLASC